MKCYYCGADIKKGLHFCPKCDEPLLTCPKCGKYLGPLSNFCDQCSAFLGELYVPEHVMSDSLKLSALLGTDASSLIEVKTKRLEDLGLFDLRPLIALGYMFVVSQSGRIWVLNLHTLESYNVGFTQLPLTEVKSDPILVRHIVQREGGMKLCKNSLCVASSEEMLLLSIKYKSQNTPIVLQSHKKWKLEGKCRTDPLYLKRNIIIGTDQGLFAYDVDGEKVWEYNYGRLLSKEHIATTLSADGDRVFFGSHKGTNGRIHCVYADNGSPAWLESYSIHANGIDSIHVAPDSERLIVYDHDGGLYNLSIDGESHYAPVPSTIKERPTAVGRSGEHIYIATSSGSIHCLDLLGDMVKTEYESGRHLFFHPRPVMGDDFMLFAAQDCSFFFVETTHNTYNRMEVRAEAAGIPGELMTTPTMSSKYLYVLSSSGCLARIGTS